MPLPDFDTLQPVEVQSSPDFASLRPIQKLNLTQRKEALRADPRFQPEEVPLMTRIGAMLEPVVEPYTMHGILSQPNRAIDAVARKVVGHPVLGDPNTTWSPIPAPEPAAHFVGPGKPERGMTVGPALSIGMGTGGGVGLGGTPIGLPGLAEGMAGLKRPEGQTVGERFPGVFSTIAGIGRGAQQLGHDLLNVENLAMAPAFVESAIVRALAALTLTHKGVEDVEALPERAQELGQQPGASMGELAPLIAGPVGDLLMARAMGKSLVKPPPQPSRAVPTEFSIQALGDIPIKTPELPDSARGPELAQPFNPLQLQQGGPQTRFQIGPDGRAQVIEPPVAPSTPLPKPFVPKEKSEYGGKLFSGMEIKPEDARRLIVPAIRIGREVFRGKQGDHHDDIFKANGFDPKEYPPEAPERVFELNGQILDRHEAAKALGVPGSAKAGGLDSQDIRQKIDFRTEQKQYRSVTEQQPTPAAQAPVGETALSEFKFKGRETGPDTFSRAMDEIGYAREGGRQIIGGRVGSGGAKTTADMALQDMSDERFKQVYLKAYISARRLIEKEHPDRGGNEEVFKRVNDAWQRKARPLFEAEARSRGIDLKMIIGEEKAKSPSGRLYSGIPLEFAKKEKELRGPFALAGPRIALTPSEVGFKDTSKEVDALQLRNRIKNKVHASEWAFYEDVLPKGGKISPEAAAKLMQESGPKVEVRKFGEGSQTETQKRMARLTHEFYDTLTEGQRKVVNNVADSGKLFEYGDLADDIRKGFVDQANEYIKTRRQFEEEGLPATESSHWSSIAPKPESEMPGYVELAVVKPLGKSNAAKRLERIQRLKSERELTSDEQIEYQKATKYGNTFPVEDPQFPSSHSFPPNTLAFVRGYMETTKDGKKVFHVIEVQSDWAQKVREVERSDNPRQYAVRDKVENDPLLRHYERLALKAAVDHARSEGADAVAIQDAESAMMTEGHDRQLDDIGNPLLASEIPQASGMRLHYDTTLPKIMQELTGEEGEKVSFGNHRQAMAEHSRSGYDGNYTEPRRDLVFRNPDNTPKIDVSALSFDLKLSGGPGPEPSKAPFSVFEKDKPDTRPTYLYSGIPLDLKRQWESHKADLKIVFGSLGQKHEARTLSAAKLDAVDNAPQITQNKVEGTLYREANRLSGTPTTYEKSISHNKVKMLRAAATIYNEAQGDISKLSTFIAQATAKGWTDGVEAAKFAQANWANARALAKTADFIDDQNLALAKSWGVDIPSRDFYTKRWYEQEPRGFFFRNEPPPGIGVGSKLPRKYATIYDAVADGVKPPASMDIAALVGHRTREIMQEVNFHAYVNFFKNRQFNGSPIFTDLGKPIRGIRLPPQGYAKLDVGPGLSVGVIKPLANTFKRLFKGSFVSESLTGQFLLNAEGLMKHSTLVFDSFHLLRVLQFHQSINLGGNYKHGLALLELSKGQIDEAIRQKQFPVSAKAYVNQTTTLPQGTLSNIEIASGLIRDGYNVAKHSEALYSSAARSLPLLKQTVGRFNRYVFDKVTRGAMMDAGVFEVKRVAKENPTWSIEKVRQTVARDLNYRFGNLGRQGMLKSKSAQDIAQIMFLAPRWVESMVQSEGRSVVQGVKASIPFTESFGKRPPLLRSTSNLLFAYFVGTQILNEVFQGHPTWQNPDDSKMDALIKMPGGKQFKLSPLSVGAEITHDVIRYAKMGKSPGDIASAMTENKASPIVRALDVGFTGGPMTRGQGGLGAGLGELVPTPLPLRSTIKSIKEGDPVPAERQAFSMLGFKAEPETHTEEVERKTKGMSLHERAEFQNVQKKELKEKDLRKTPEARSADALRAGSLAREAEVRRGTDVAKALSKADRQWLESRGLSVSGFDNKISVEGTKVTLAKGEMDKLQSYIVEELSTTMKDIREQYDTIPEDYRSKYLSKMMSAAKERARARLIDGLDSRGESNSPAKKRFSIYDYTK